MSSAGPAGGAAPRPCRVFVCSGPRCARRQSRFVRVALERSVRERGLTHEVAILRTNGGCLGQCELGPNLTVHPEGVRYFGVAPADADEIAREHLAGGRPVERLLGSGRVESRQHGDPRATP
jgi:(2Fe-2S) ferredoxin